MPPYHMNVRRVTRGAGKSASATYEYVARQGRHSRGDKAAELELIVSGNLPGWAADGEEYWRATDRYEGKNRVLCLEGDVALPRQLSREQNTELARRIAKAVAGESLPYTVAYHHKDENPHIHLMYAERALDGHDRTPEKWFKKANKRKPERGGAAKLKAVRHKDWLREKRQAVSAEINRTLEAAGRPERVDHRSLWAQRIDAIKRGDTEAAAALARTPGVHRGPALSNNPENVPELAAAVERRQQALEARRQQQDQLAEILQRHVEAGVVAVQLEMIRKLEDARPEPPLRSASDRAPAQPNRIDIFLPQPGQDRTDNVPEYARRPQPNRQAPPALELAPLEWDVARTFARRASTPEHQPTPTPPTRIADRPPAGTTRGTTTSGKLPTFAALMAAEDARLAAETRQHGTEVAPPAAAEATPPAAAEAPPKPREAKLPPPHVPTAPGGGATPPRTGRARPRGK